MVHQNTHSVSVAGVIIDDDGRALLTQRRDNGHWEAPGGILERDEDITSGLLREVLEETGIHVEPVALTGVYKNMTRGIVALVFRCKVIGGHLTETDETRAFRGSPRTRSESLASEAFAVRVLDAMQHDQAPAVRHHDGIRLLGQSRPTNNLAELFLWVSRAAALRAAVRPAARAAWRAAWGPVPTAADPGRRRTAGSRRTRTPAVGYGVRAAAPPPPRRSPPGGGPDLASMAGGDRRPGTSFSAPAQRAAVVTAEQSADVRRTDHA